MDKAKYILTGNMVFITTISSLILFSSSAPAGAVTADASVTVPTSCSLSGTGMDSHNANIPSGTYQGDIGITTLKATCNDNDGFAIYAIGFTNEEHTGENHTKLIGVNNGQKISTGIAESGATSNWAMKLNTITSPTPAFPITLDNGYSSYKAVPETYTKVAHRATSTDVGSSATGSVLTTTYAAYISSDQTADTYNGKVKYTLVHPQDETPLVPEPATPGYITYYAVANTAVGTMGRQKLEYAKDWSLCVNGTDYESYCEGATESVDTSDFGVWAEWDMCYDTDYETYCYDDEGNVIQIEDITHSDWDMCYDTDYETYCYTIPEIDISDLPTLSYATPTLFASNFSLDGYGFAGWSDAIDYKDNSDANFYGPNEDIVVSENNVAKGLTLYAVWIESAGNLQDSAKVSQLCGSNGGLVAASYNNNGDSDESTWSIAAGLSSLSALTDTRDGQTYAIAKLADNKCWIIENLRLSDAHQESNSAVPTTLTIANTNNPLNDGTNVTLKHNYSDTTTYPTLSPTSSSSSSWCSTSSAACVDQSRIMTSSTTNRATYTTTQNLSVSTNLYLYGNYYNWYSATAGRGTYSKTSGNTVGDICPAGWHLPTGAGSGEFGKISNSLGGYKISTVAQSMGYSTTPTAAIMSQRLRHFPNNFVYSGNVLSGGTQWRGSYGVYSSSSAANSSCNKSLTFSVGNTNFDANINCNKSLGRTIRCIASTNL